MKRYIEYDVPTTVSRVGAPHDMNLTVTYDLDKDPIEFLFEAKDDLNLETLKALYTQMKSYEDKQWIGFLIAKQERKKKWTSSIRALEVVKSA